MRRILIVEDDRKIADLIRLYLERDGYHVVMAYDGREGLELARSKRPDLIVLDLMLPRMDGLEVCRAIRAEANTPIVMLTAKTTEEDKLTGLDLGADDYITKPFSPREVVARVRAVLRRAAETDSTPRHIAAGDLTLDLVGHQAHLRGEPLRLTPKEFKLLAVMAREPGRTFSRLELLERVFGLDYDGLERTVDVHVMNLRKKIEPDPAQPIYIQTAYGVGYRFVGDSGDVE